MGKPTGAARCSSAICHALLEKLQKLLDIYVSNNLLLVMAYIELAGPASNPGIMAVLADPARQNLLEVLRHRPFPVGELARHVPVSRPAVSQHLKILKGAQLVHEDRQGTRHYFSLNPAGFAALHEYVDSMWQDALSAFAVYVEQQQKISKKSHPRKRKDG